jgi:DNA-directed RNA polymerase specialized sigma24 family protein
MIHPWLLARASALAGRGRVDPEEVAATALTCIFLASRTFRFRGPEAFRGWMLVIVRNTVRKTFRTVSAGVISLEGIPEPEDRRRLDPAALVSCREEAEAGKRAWCLLALLCTESVVSRSSPAAGNRPLDRLILEWHHCRGMTFREIGRRLGRRPEQVGGMVRRARQKIIAYLVRTLASWV